MHRFRPLEWLSNGWHLFVQWAAVIASLGVIVFFLLHHLHVVHWLPDHEKGIEISLFYIVPGILFLIAELARETHVSQAKQAADVQREMAAHASRLRDVIANLHPELYHLVACLNDLSKRAEASPPNDELVVIEHLGLDMFHAWDLLQPILEQHPHVRNIEYRLVMISPKGAGNDGKDVQHMRRNAEGMIEKIRSQLDGRKGPLQAAGRRLRFQLRVYRDSPTVHGIAIRRPASLRMGYVAFCRWGGPTFEEFKWGGSGYHRIYGDTQDPRLKDLVDVFDGYFHHYWRQSSDVINFSTDS
jgi:hypothetical protein